MEYHIFWLRVLGHERSLQAPCASSTQLIVQEQLVQTKFNNIYEGTGKGRMTKGNDYKAGS
jgi:hypothetical protein